jgi:5-formyltetrahydrofolate cyclo-ligase
MELDNRTLIPMLDVAEQKRQLRRSCHQIRTGLDEAARQPASLAICGWIESGPVFQRSAVILAYMPIPGEACLTSLFERQPQKRWVLPRIIPAENHLMVFHPYDAGRLVLHPFGMAEPTPNMPIVLSSEVQLALVPGLAFDRLGVRLGYGGGYFDRFLRDFTGITLGVIFQALLFDHLPSGKHDLPVEWIVTEAGFLHPNPKT